MAQRAEESSDAWHHSDQKYRTAKMPKIRKKVGSYTSTLYITHTDVLYYTRPRIARTPIPSVSTPSLLKTLPLRTAAKFTDPIYIIQSTSSGHWATLRCYLCTGIQREKVKKKISAAKKKAKKAAKKDVTWKSNSARSSHRLTASLSEGQLADPVYSSFVLDSVLQNRKRTSVSLASSPSRTKFSKRPQN